MESELKVGTGMAGVYKEIAKFAGEEMTRLMHENFKGQQIVFPNKLYSSNYITQIKCERGITEKILSSWFVNMVMRSVG